MLIITIYSTNGSSATAKSHEVFGQVFVFVVIRLVLHCNLHVLLLMLTMIILKIVALEILLLSCMSFKYIDHADPTKRQLLIVLIDACGKV